MLMAVKCSISEKANSGLSLSVISLSMVSVICSELESKKIKKEYSRSKQSTCFKLGSLVVWWNQDPSRQAPSHQQPVFLTPHRQHCFGSMIRDHRRQTILLLMHRQKFKNSQSQYLRHSSNFISCTFCNHLTSSQERWVQYKVF